MKKEILESLSYISDEMIVEAMNSSGKYRRARIKKFLTMAASLILVVGIMSVVFISRDLNTVTGGSNPSGVTPPIFVGYNGDTYLFTGEIIDELPDGYVYYGDTTVIDNLNAIEDLDSSFEGKIYVDDDVKEIVYFQYKESEDAPDGFFTMCPH